MTNNTHKESPQEPTTIAGELRRILPQLALSGLVAFAFTWWQNQLALNDYKYKIDRLEERVTENARQSAEQAKAVNDVNIRLAVVSEQQRNVLDQLAEVKAEHMKLRR